MTLLKPYRMKLPRKQREEPPLNRLYPIDEEEGLTGRWGDIELGSEEEERLLRGLSKLGRRFTPQYEVDTPYSLPGQGKQIDVVIWDSLLPVEVDGPFHRQQYSQELDAQRDAVLNDVLRPKGFQLIKRIDYVRLADQRAADLIAEELQ